MKLDLDYIKEILTQIENVADGISEQEVKVSETSPAEVKRQAYHYRILLDADLIDGRILDAGSRDGRAEFILYRGLTIHGHQALEAMRNDTIWNKVKSLVKSAGVAGVEKIPGLAIELFLKE